MLEHETNISQFAGVNALQKDIERLTKERDALSKERENAQTNLLEEHSITLKEMTTTLALLVDRTKDLPELGKRVTRHCIGIHAHRNLDRRRNYADVSEMKWITATIFRNPMIYEVT
jgi:phosphoenolpyruvate-protein kinase (PTS system EI component)